MIEFLLGVAFGLSLGVVVGGMLRHTNMPEPPGRQPEDAILVLRYRDRAGNYVEYPIGKG